MADTPPITNVLLITLDQFRAGELTPLFTTIATAQSREGAIL
jgi:hypothetical protein